MDRPPGRKHGPVGHHDRHLHHSGLRHDAVVDLYARPRHLREGKPVSALLADFDVRGRADSAPVHRVLDTEVPEEGGQVPREDPEGVLGVVDYFYNRFCNCDEFVFVRAVLLAGKEEVFFVVFFFVIHLQIDCNKLGHGQLDELDAQLLNL